MQRPKASPYTSPLATLHIGASRRAYYIRQDLLQRPEWKNYSPDWIHLSMRLHSVDEDTGHVLVHYLCTDTYQTLDNIDASTADNRRVEFKRAVLVYYAARTYELYGLQKLAIENIEHYGMEMTTLDLFDLVNQEFPDFHDKTGCFYEYLKKKAKAAFKNDCTSFAEGAILDRISNVELIKMLAKCVVELYTTMVNDKVDCIQTASEGIVCGVKNGPSGEALLKETPAEALLVNDVLAEEVYNISAAGPTTEERVAEERVTAGSQKRDESVDSNPWNFTDKKVKKDSSRSGFDVNFDAFDDPIQILDPAVVVVEQKPTENEHWGFGLGLRSKNKSKTKKGSSAIIEEPTIESKSELMPEPAKTADDWSSCTFGGATDKSAAATLIEETSPSPLEPKPVPEPVKEVNSFELDASAAVGGAKKKQGKKAAIAETKEEPKVEGPPPPPAPIDDWDSFPAPLTTGKKKKSMKAIIAETKDEPSIEEPPPLPPAEPEYESLPPLALMDNCGSFPARTSAGKKKKSKKAVTAETKEEPKVEEPPPPAPIYSWGSFIAPATTDKENKSKKATIVETKEESEVKKDAKKARVEELPPPPPPEPETKPEPAPFVKKKPLAGGWGTGTHNDWGAGAHGSWGTGAHGGWVVDAHDGWGAAAAASPVKKAKKGKKASTVAALPDPPDPPEKEPLVEVALPDPVVQEELDDYLERFLSSVRKTTKKSKKGKKGAVEEPLAPPPPLGSNECVDSPTEISVAEDTEAVLQTDYLDCPASPISDFIFLEPLVEPIPKPCEEYIPVQSEDATLELSRTALPSLDRDSEYTETESRICPTRAKHLLEGDMWKDCRQCRAVLRQVAIQLANQVDKDTYEIVDGVLLE